MEMNNVTLLSSHPNPYACHTSFLNITRRSWIFKIKSNQKIGEQRIERILVPINANELTVGVLYLLIDTDLTHTLIRAQGCY